MNLWVRAALVITGIAIVALVGGYFANQYIPSLSSSISQSLSIVILSVGIASGSIAVLSGRWLEERYKRQNEEKRIRSALVSYFSGLPFQIRPISSSFHGISVHKRTPLPPTGVADRINSTLLNHVQSMFPPYSIDTSYYDKFIKDHLLYLPEPLARQSLTVVTIVTQLNFYYNSFRAGIMSMIDLFREQYSSGFVITEFLNAYTEANRLISELAKEGSVLIQNLTLNLLKGEQKILNLQGLILKMRTINEKRDEAGRLFQAKLLPDQDDKVQATGI